MVQDISKKKIRLWEEKKTIYILVNQTTAIAISWENVQMFGQHHSVSKQK